MTQEPKLTQEQLAAVAYAEAVRQASDRLKARTFEDVEKWVAGEKILNTPIPAQMQAVSMVAAAAVYAAVKQISGAQRDMAALTILRGISETVRDLLNLEARVRADVGQQTERAQ